MERNREKCGCEDGKCRCETNETEKLIINKGEDDDPNENGESFISLRSFPKTIQPEIILGIGHSKFTKEQIDSLFGARG
mgnify:CR=1 FL=1